MLMKKTLYNKHLRTSRRSDPDDVIAEVKGERYRDYRRLYNGAGNGEIELSFPVDLAIEVIDYCNYSCPYCPRAVDPGSGAVMSMEIYQRLIDDFVAANGGLGGVGFGRGEPMLDKSLERKVSYAIDKGLMDVILTTNGVFLSPNRSGLLIDAGLTKLHVSLDAATQETYDKTRGGDLAQVENNIREFLRVRDSRNRQFPIVRVSFVVTELNRHEVALFEEKWAAVVDYVDFQKCLDFSRTDSLPDFETEPFWCAFPFRTISVDAGGRIKPCCPPYADKLVFGQVGDGDTIVDVFGCEKTEALRRSFRERQGYGVVCKNCRGIPRPDSRIVPRPLLKPTAGTPLGRVDR